MQHFGDEKWLDLARRLVPVDEERQMRAHLDAGCRQCAEVFSVWTAVHRIVGREANNQPDDSLVHAAKCAFESRLSPRAIRSPAIRFADLVFDSFTTAGAMAGVRSISSAARHLLYSAGHLSIDVRLDALSGTVMTITGQILGTVPHVLPGDKAVEVISGDVMIASTRTNEFGEFQFDVNRSPDVRLRVYADDAELFVLPLPD